MKIKTKQDRRRRLRLRSRTRIRGTSERPRLAVFRSVAHIYVQAVDDATGRTVASASSAEPATKAAFVDGARGGNVNPRQKCASGVSRRGHARFTQSREGARDGSPTR